jgi:glycosyltransferase involved in cell wall biosynthesis
LSQTYPHFEIIITDNSTNDDTAKLAAAWTDPRLRYYSNHGNIGATPSAKRAISMAVGKYLKILMDDDLIKPRSLELMVKALEENPTAALAMAPMDIIGEDFQRIYPRFYMVQTMRYRFRYQMEDGLIERQRVLHDFLTGVQSHKPSEYPCTVPSGFLLRAEAFHRAGPPSPDVDFAADLELCIKLASEWDFYYIDQVLSSWRYIPEGHTGRLHQSGLKINVFYTITRHCLAREKVKEMFREEWEKTVRDSIFFCSCRALLNGVAGIRARSPKLIFTTIATILREDKYVFNWLRLPLFVIREIFVSIFPRHDPPPRE